MSFSPRRIMADVLLMPTLQLGNPIRLLISVETSDFARLTSRWLMRIHDVLSGVKYGAVQIKDRRNGVQTFSDFLCHSDGDSILRLKFVYQGFRSRLAANRK